ncbi:hypothetical protein MBRA1_003064 [Malassezia brasiliensis]|uniref:Charged multivesicular body protein 7 n=1 Tax=Malassezia brasiliensis TaxID=1821822 RepID=A0AAF0IPM7_9BASI|nr:hypothetical protein MBRA1_003064 [Malassezia brasiliensis]
MDALRAYIAALPEARGSGDALASMYADLGGQRASDPNAFRTKVDWWTRTLRDMAWRGLVTNTMSLTLDDALLTGLARPSTGRPLCIAVVMEELVRQRRAMRRADFLSQTTSVHQRSPLSRVLWEWVAQPVWRAATNAWHESDALGDEDAWHRMHGEWVLLDNVEQAAQLYRDAEAQRIRGVLDSVLSRTELHAQFASLHDAHGRPHLTPADYVVLERYLERDDGMLVTDGDLVKIVARGAPRSVNEADRGVFAVRNMHRKLTAQVDELEARIKQAHARIVQALRTKQPEERAKAYLRTKKQLEEMLTKRVGALETVHSLLLQMEQAVGDAEIVRNYETSAATLRTILADPALQPARVDATMDALAESVEQGNEVHAALTSQAAPVDDDEIARELEQLALDARDERVEPTEPAKQLEPSKQSETEAKKATTPTLPIRRRRPRHVWLNA